MAVKSHHLSLALVLVLMSASVLLAAPMATDPVQQFDSLLLGNWTGALEYRDFSSNKMVKLPTTLTVTRGSAADSVSLAFTFEDGPNKIVKDTLDVAVDSASSHATITDSGNPASAYDVSGLDQFNKTGEIILTKDGTDNDKPAKIRETIKLAKDKFDYLREVEPNGATSFAFRHEYVFSRDPSSK